MLIEVIPLDASIDDRGLTYYVSPELADVLEIGALVEIPLKQELGPAVVARHLGESQESDLRSISRVLCPYPVLAPYQIETIYSLASRYFVHIHKVLNLFFPRSVYTAFEKKEFRNID